MKHSIVKIMGRRTQQLKQLTYKLNVATFILACATVVVKMMTCIVIFTKYYYANETNVSVKYMAQNS